LYLPYRCPSCDEEDSTLVDVVEQYDDLMGTSLHTRKCSSCGSDSEFLEAREMP
jgi:hypothetical protein